MPNWLKTILKIITALIVVILVLVLGIMAYISSNKAKVQAMVTTELNKSLDGTVVIGKLNPVFFSDFPDISLSLHNVLIRDKRFNEHHHTFLNAQDFDISVNTAALLKGTISINHVDISNAAIDLFTDSNGYSNTSVFKKSDHKKAKNKDDAAGGSAAEISRFKLNNVSFAVNNQRLNKLFSFDVNALAGIMEYPDTGWHANIHMDVSAKSLAFNTDNGSFIKGKHIIGDLIAGYNEDKEQITVTSGKFDIGGNIFGLNANFMPAKALFNINLNADAITWRGASLLVADNIRQKLNMFNIEKPIQVKAQISGSFKGGDPFLDIHAKLRDTKVVTPGGNIDDCSFDAQFTNNYEKGKGFNDANSVIRLYHMKGSYNHIPFAIDTGSIINLEKPVATGNFVSNFPVTDLNYLLGGKIAKFTKGTASMKLRYKADIVDYKLNKPVFSGLIEMKNADINYMPKHLILTNTSFSLNFTQDNLIMSNIRLQSGKSIVYMNGRVNNFLNLYYDSPEKIVLNWQIRSPQLYLGEFLGFLNRGQQAAIKKSKNSGNIIDQLSNVLDKAHAEMHLQVNNLHYKNFLATDAKADVLLSEDGVVLNNMSVKHAGGSLKINGQIMDGATQNKFICSAVATNVNIHEFFYAFDNFGMKDFNYNNLKGFLSTKAQITGEMTNAGAIVPQSMNGWVTINLKDAVLINYNPLKTIGKFAFPFRDLNHIEIANLEGKFDLHGDKITINPMQITSNVMNIDVSGTYGFSGGTNIALDIPLRNPKGDSTITDKAELLKKRYNGIVLHILAKDDEKGKLKIGWNKDHAKTP